MMIRKLNLLHMCRIPTFCVILFFMYGHASGQSVQEDEGSRTKEMRQMWQNVVNRRPRSQIKVARPTNAVAKSSVSNQGKEEPKPEYKLASPMIPHQGQDIGITIWRLRPSHQIDASAVKQEVKTKRLKQPPGGAPGDVTYLTAERVETDTSLHEGEMVQLSVEVPQEGFLYVIDRERYSDGRVGEPYLLFPTSRTNNGDNRVGPGILLNIPAMSDDPPFLTLDRSGANHIGEEITFVVTPKQIPELSRYKEQGVVSEELFRKLEGWTAQTGRIELVGGTGVPQTEEEAVAAKGSGRDGAKRLKHNSPVPQTIFRVARKSGDPMSMTILLKIAP